MGCEQSKPLEEATRKSSSSSTPPTRQKGIGATERRIGNYIKRSGLVDDVRTTAPKLDPAGFLLQEEVVKRTQSSIQVSEAMLGNYHKGHIVRVRYAYHTQRGYYPDDPHKANQDDYSITTEFAGEKGDAMFAVYDGHGSEGHDAAAFAKKKLPYYIAKNIRQMRVKEYQRQLKAEGKSTKGSYKPEFWPILSASDYEAACRKGFVECDKAMHDDPNTECKLSGTTAVSASFHMGRITVCNVGDSRIVLGHRIRENNVSSEEEKNEIRSITHSVDSSQAHGSKDGICVAIPLTKDQTPYRKDERERVKRAGAVVCTIDQLEGREPMHEQWSDLDANAVDHSGDPPRVWEEGKEYPGCAFTRSLGDYIADRCGVIAIPEMVTTILTRNDEYLVIASDGVFEFLTNQFVIDICVASKDPLEACDNIVKASYEHWLKHENRTDDITVTVLFLDCENDPITKAGTTEELVGRQHTSDFKPIRMPSRQSGTGGSIRFASPEAETA